MNCFPCSRELTQGVLSLPICPPCSRMLIIMVTRRTSSMMWLLEKDLIWFSMMWRQIARPMMGLLATDLKHVPILLTRSLNGKDCQCVVRGTEDKRLHRGASKAMPSPKNVILHSSRRRLRRGFSGYALASRQMNHVVSALNARLHRQKRRF